ncbi:hypothetical protein ACFXNW_24105 [Nocardia sp. NPDC059180]|uniref:hypothetical protein n=1 Tax=Nocardia sp. NPDC059180 TaxID=3346761 RepID=UPI00368DE18B
MSDNDSEGSADRPSRAVSAWTTGLVCVSIVACGVIVGGLLHEPEPELTTAPPTTTRAVPLEPEEHTYLTPSVTYPTQIPGCDTVDPPADGELFGWAAVDEFGYDNPGYPWFSGPKAVAMSAAVHDALPSGVVLDFAPIDDSLFFQPILGDPETTEFDNFTNARASLRRGEHAGSLSVSVRPSDEPIPPCVAGQLEERRHLADTTVVDTQDSWSETDGVRTLSRSATAYLPDGSVVTANATDAPDGNDPTGTVPLTIDELVTLVTVPGVRVTAAVPPGTPQPPEPCYFVADRTPQIDEATARRLGAVLSEIPMEGLVLDRPLGQLLPGSLGGLCQKVRVTADGQQTLLSISIDADQPLPTEPARPFDHDDLVSDRRLADGSVVELRESRFGSSDGTGPMTQHTDRTITVTRPNGTKIEVSSTADSPTEPLSTTQLEAIALAPGLEVQR